MKETVLITGGAGFIGYHLTKKFVQEGHKVVIFDAFINFVQPGDNRYLPYLHQRLAELHQIATVIRGDTRDTKHMMEVLAEYKPEIVVNLTAIPIATISNQISREAHEININGIMSILDAIRFAGNVKRFVYTSSSFVYGNFVTDPATEEHPLEPIDVYGGTKLAGEVLTKSFGRRFGIEYAIVRPSAVYGATDANRRVTQIFVENALRGEPLTLHDGGAGRVDFTYIDDVVNGFFLVATHPAAANEIFNITAGQGRSMKEFADILSNLIPNVKTVVKPAEEVRPNRGSLSVEKARRMLGYNPTHTLEIGMAKYVPFVKENLNI